ncbi:MAG TPA: MBL fold metallo-hydrolase [Actinomycetota bacterium]|nr:MBL fold metallo-hydrolase [Actinomycetota bacterium]
MEIRSFLAAELGNSSHLLLVPEAELAIAIDPQRDIDQYLEAVDPMGLKLKWALETHVHNDFVSGARELQAEAGASLGASSDAGLRYPFSPLRDGQEIEAGPYRLRVMATPGHTPEHISYVLLDESGRPLTLFSGGSLMVGTAARPDLLGPANSWRLAHLLRQSLQERVMSLPDDVRVLPTHGGGSFCAAGAGGQRETTIGRERTGNPLVAASSDAAFAEIALAQGPYPSYFERMRGLNQLGAPLLGRTLPTPPRLSLESFDAWRAQGAAVLDLRTAEAFAEGHVPDSYAVGIDDNHSAWVGWLLSPDKPLVLVADNAAQEEESVRQLARIGYDLVIGALDSGFRGWADAGRPVASYGRTTAQALKQRLLGGERIVVVDVREANEWFAGHVPGSVNIPAHDLPVASGQLPLGASLAVHCGHHYRATLGASLLERSGFANPIVVEDGYEGWTVIKP